MSLLSVDRHRVEFRAGGAPRAALRGVSFAIDAPAVVGVGGASGSGKSTLLRAIAGILRPQAGSVRHAGTLQYLPQDPMAMLHPTLPIGAWLRESARRHRRGEDPDALTAAALRRCGLGGRGDARPWELSGGERRRVGLARVSFASPTVLLADEPTSGLDAERHAQAYADLRAAAPVVLIVSHDLGALAAACDRLLLIHAGAITDDLGAAAVLDGTAEVSEVGRALLTAAGWRPTR